MLTDAIPLHALKRVLVIKLRHHGDVLLASPVLSTLKVNAPQAEIDALVYSETAAMLDLHPALSELHVIDRQWKKLRPWQQLAAEYRLAKNLRNRQYDLVVHLTDHPRGAWIARYCGARWAVAPKTQGRGKWWNNAFTHFVSSPRNALRHTVERNLDVLRRIGIFPTKQSQNLCLIAENATQNRVAALLSTRLADLPTPTEHFIHIHPASRWTFKCWSTHKMAALINRLHALGHCVVLTAAPEAQEEAMIAAINAELERPALSLAGQLSLKEMAALSARAALFIGVDSAPMHIAAAVNTPVVALFGPSGDKEWGPWLVPQRIITSQNHPCRPCGIDGCGGSKMSDCLETLEVDHVLTAALELLNNAH